jgi:zinc transporter 1/2/3
MVEKRTKILAAAEWTESEKNAFKIIMAIVLFCECYLGLLPMACGACTKNQLPLSFLNCFSAGIFLSMAMIHIIPESIGIYKTYACRAWPKTESPFPLPYLLVIVGYILILIIDRWLAASFHISDSDEAPVKRGD